MMKRWLCRVGPIFVLSLGLWIVPGWGQERGQPIVYNHQKHVAEMSMACLDCHANVETQARASIPNIKTCGDCHSDPEAENAELRKVAKYVADGVPIAWKQIHSVPDYVYFSHRRHVKLGEIECAVCHGDVSAMTTPFAKPFVPIKMKWCIDCHEQRAVSNDCAACHR
jgi:Cytochrome c7 and related cytochrome c